MRAVFSLIFFVFTAALVGVNSTLALVYSVWTSSMTDAIPMYVDWVGVKFEVISAVKFVYEVAI